MYIFKHLISFYTILNLILGGSPRSLPIPGWELENVFVLRTPADAKAIVKAATG